MPQPPADPAPVAEAPPAPPVEPAKVEPPPPPPPPKMWNAQAALAPVKGAKVKPATLVFSQEEGKPAAVTSGGALEGLAPGKYHLVIHESADCGPNATKAGKPWTDGTLEVTIEVAKDKPGTVENANLAVALEGEKTIVGRTLVLHADKKGKADKAIACGAIANGEAAGGAMAPNP
ncbi:MAG: superoxide dismutase family protein [Kofleriaceae bacterium]